MSVKTILKDSLGLLAGKEDTVDITDQLAQLEREDQAAQLLEQSLAEDAKDPAKAASIKLESFSLSETAQTLLQRAIENAARNTGNGIDDPNAKLKIKSMADLLAASDNDLSAALIALTEAMPIAELPNAVFSLCFSVQKASMFIGNLMYRRALDPKDGEGTPAHDHRDHRDPPYGLGPDADEDEGFEDVKVLRAIEDVHLFLQLTAEAFGWDPEQPMPFVYMQEKDGTFSRITDVEQALDYLEIRRKQSQAKRQERQAAGYAAAAERAKAALLSIAAKRAAAK